MHTYMRARKCSTFLVARELQVKTRIRYPHIPIRMAKIKVWGGGARLCDTSYNTQKKIFHDFHQGINYNS